MEGVIILSRPSDRRMMPPRQCSSPSFLLPLASLGKYVVGVQFSLVSCESQSQELLLGCKHVISERGARGSPGWPGLDNLFSLSPFFLSLVKNLLPNNLFDCAATAAAPHYSP